MSNKLPQKKSDRIWFKFKNFFKQLLSGKKSETSKEKNEALVEKNNLEEVETSVNLSRTEKEENIFTELRKEHRISQTKNEIIEIVETNPRTLKKMNNQRLKELNEIYDERINKNELKIRELRNKLQKLKQNNV